MWRKSLLDWYDANGRMLPWRLTRDPYRILVSELMCQQTQVATVVPYYERWLARFPTAEALSNASEQEVLGLWQGLGYYRRARFLLQAANYLVRSGVPQSAVEWQQVPGVGRYTAGALASICLGQPEAVVDGNVERVYARFACDSLAGSSLHRATWVWATESMNPDRPGDWNQALMELGALVCKPTQPLCEQCPIQKWCRARQAGHQNELPTKTAKQALVQLKQIVYVPALGGRFGVRQIAAGKWWEGLWEFPREEDELALAHLVGDATVRHLGVVRHTVTNHKISISAYLVSPARSVSELTWLTTDELCALPMPAPQRKILGLALAHVVTE